MRTNKNSVPIFIVYRIPDNSGTLLKLSRYRFKTRNKRNETAVKRKRERERERLVDLRVVWCL